VQRVVKNTGIIIAGNVIFRLISLVIIIYLARYLGTVGFGKYSFVFAYLAFFDILCDLGLSTILVREAARNRINMPKLLGNGLIIRLILTIFAVVLAVVIITLLPYPADTTAYTYIAAFTLLFLSFSGFYSIIFQVNLRMEYNIFAKLIFRIISAVLIFWLIFSHGTLMQIIIVLVFSEGIKTLITYLFSRKFVRLKFEIDFDTWKYLFKESLPIALSSVIFMIYFRIDVIMLSLMVGDGAVGIYSAALKLSEPLTIIPTALMMSLFPLMSGYFETSRNKLIKSYHLSIKYLFIITLPIAIGTTLIADKIILLIYDSPFADSATVLQILIWALVLNSVNFVLSNVLTSINQQKLITVSVALCAIVNVILNFILIPIFKCDGAAIATVMTNVVLFTASFYFVAKHFQILPLHKIIIKPLISGLIMGVFVYYFIDLDIFFLVCLAGFIYFISLFALNTFSEEDWNIIKKIVSMR
jgi:O-antigen/teichoic acid export membrane protein